MNCAEVEKVVFSCIGPVFQLVIGELLQYLPQYLSTIQ